MAHTIFWLVLLVALDGTRGVLGVRTGGRAVVLIMSVPPQELALQKGRSRAGPS